MAVARALTKEVPFGHVRLSVRQLFFQSAHSLGVINYKPIVPGHVMVIARRAVARVADLTPEEAADLFRSAHMMAPRIEKEYGASSLTIAVQDGKDAGQTVAHVHIHILPRRPGDFERNDDVYDELEKTDAPAPRIDNEERVPLTLEQMGAEAERLSRLFPEENRFDVAAL